MPSPSPTSRRSSSSVASRNFSGCSRADTLAPRGLQQNFYTASSNSAASRALHENIDDHKENSAENGNGRGAPGRSNQNQKGPSKKPWVTHFSKPATTLSPGNRVLVDRNSSCSPIKLGSIAGNGETLSDKKVARPTTPRGQEEAPTTPGPGKGVAELSKRIQQFLEDQDVLLGVKAGNGLEVTSTCPSGTPVDQGQRPSSSPYNPYKSPFFERPKFLRLNGNVFSVEGVNMAPASTDGTDLLIEPPEELPLFEGDQVLVTPLQQIQFSKSLSPSSNEDKELRLESIAKEQICGTATVKDVSVNTLEAKALPTSEDVANCSNQGKAPRNEGTGKPPDEDETGTVQALGQFQDGGMASQADQISTADIEVKVVTVNVALQESNSICQDKDQNLSMEWEKSDEEVVTENVPLKEGFSICQDGDQDLSMESAKCVEEVITSDGHNVSFGKRAIRVMFCGTILGTFLTLVLLSSGSPGLLPPSLVDNPVNSFWQSSKYHEQSMMLMQGLDGLWSTEMIYIPADAHVAVLRGAKLYDVISEVFNQAHQELQLCVQVVSSMVDDWGRVLVQQITLSKNHDTARVHEDRARQFEWIQEFEFEEEWVDEFPKIAYTDWELLHEYDLGAANQFVLGSIPESLKNDLRRNFSHLSDSPEVKDLLEDLMKLKGGSTEEDRLEVLQYFWEYRRFSASAHENLMKFQLETPAMEDGNKTQSFSTFPDHRNVKPYPENVEMHHDQGQQTFPSLGSIEHFEVNRYQTPTEQHAGLFEDDEQHLDDMEEQLLDIDQEQTAPEMSETASEKLQELIVFENSQTLVLTASQNDAALSGSMHELERELGKADTSSIDIQVMEPTADVQLDIAQLATLATFIVVSLFILGCNRGSRNVTKLISHASSVQFLRKCDQPPSSLDNEVQQNKQPFADVKQDKWQVTMIEELNDRVASVLQSPEPNTLPLRSTHAKKDEDLMRSPIPTSATSPYGSFTTYKLMSKKEGQATEAKLTPVRRSSRIRNHVSMSPNANAAKRIAISPP